VKQNKHKYEKIKEIMVIQVIVAIVQQTGTILLKEYKQFKIIFEPDNSLPRHGKHDHVIPLIEGKEPQVRLMIPITEKDSLALKEYIEDMLKKGYIQHSKLLVGYLVIIVPKKDSSARPCVDY
jgi:hypothetical protein